MSNLPKETEESGPVKYSRFDKRTRENSKWCQICEQWLSLDAIKKGKTLEEKLAIHKSTYCRGSDEHRGSKA